MDLKFFKLAKQLNTNHHPELSMKNLHFRGNFNSLSLVSLSQKSPEMGKSGIKSIKKAERMLKDIKLGTPGRLTREKHLQAYIINESLLNGGKLPFGNYTFLTSEIAYTNKDKKRVVNDILALNSDNSLVIIELKSIRDSKVIQQTHDFEIKAIKENPDIFTKLVQTLSERKWNGKIKKVAVWPMKSDGGKSKIHDIDELYGYEMVNYQENGTLCSFNKILFKIEH